MTLLPTCVEEHYASSAMNKKSLSEQANVNGTALKNMRIPLPPLREQHRIVAKVDELMAMCDRLEANLTACDDTRHRLLDALLHEALKPVEHASAQGEQAAARATWPPC